LARELAEADRDLTQAVDELFADELNAGWAWPDEP